MFPWCQHAVVIVGKLRQRERLPMSAWPWSSSAKSSSQKRMVSPSVASSSPAARHVPSVTSTMKVEIPFSVSSAVASSAYW